MIRVAVVEDEQEGRDVLNRYLGQYQKERGCEFQISLFQDGSEITRDYRPEYDIILMDIQMASIDGMTAAELIRARDPEVILIFITQLAQYAIRGYAVEALDYLLKPVSYFAFSQRMDRAAERVQQRTAHYMMVPVKGGSQKVDVSRIRYVESHGHTMTLHMDKGELEVSSTMTEMEKLLKGCGFSRCNKGYLLNLACVDGIREGCAVLGEDRLLISRGRKAAFMEDLSNYIGGQTK